MNTALFGQVLRDIISTHVDEIACGECLDQLDQYAELVLYAHGAQQAMPLVYDHLQRCPDCQQELDALLTAVGTADLTPSQR